MSNTALPFSRFANHLLKDLAAGNCVAITGLSNTGKSTLMRGLAGEKAEQVYKDASGKAAILIYVDCNRAVAISAQAFYEVVLRSLLERLTDSIPMDLADTLREYHQSITESESAFMASLSFNLALNDLCENLDQNLCLLIDEFDEIYSSLDERALLNLRALRDRYIGRLNYVTATLRSLPELRAQVFADEFAEMFVHSTYHMPSLTKKESMLLLDSIGPTPLTAKRKEVCHRLAGGHPGLIIAISQVLAASPSDEEDFSSIIGRDPQVRAECLKLWSQLTSEEQDNLLTLSLEPQAGLPDHVLIRLDDLGLTKDAQPFSPIFADFLGRRARGAEVKVKGVYLDSDSGDVWVDGIRIPVLTDLEFRLLALLYERRDKLTDKYLIVTNVWGEEYLGEVDDARVEKLVSRLRSKIESDPTKPRYLITQRGRGYKLLSVARSE